MRVDRIAKPNIMISDPKPLKAKTCPAKELSSGSTTDVNESNHVVNSVCQFKPAKTEPQKSVSSAADEAAILPVVEHVNAKATSIFENVRNDCIAVEANMKKAETEARYREDLSFMVQRNEAEIALTQSLQKDELIQRKDAFAKGIEARKERKVAKKTLRTMMRQTKMRDRTISLQEEASRVAARVKEILAKKRAAFDLLVQHMENLHEKQRRQLSAAQERKLQYEKMINDIQNRHLKEEVRASLAKNLQVRINHQTYFTLDLIYIELLIRELAISCEKSSRLKLNKPKNDLILI